MNAADIKHGKTAAKQTTRRLTEAQREDLRKKWSSIRRLTSTDARIKRIALDISEHFIEGYKDTGFKAMLATNYKRDAIRYLQCFEQFGDLSCAVVISPPDMREGIDDADEGADDLVVSFWNKMMQQYGDADRYEEAIKNRFCDGEIDILIVCSKLLTGFDAPLCQVLYIDKELKEHGLLQAIARTNRLHEGKDYGLIVDYRGLIEKLDTAMDMYSGAGLENFDGGDLKGVVVDVMSAVGNLRSAYTQLVELFAPVGNIHDTEAVEVFLADDKVRQDFYTLLCAFGRALNLVLNAEQAYNALSKEERQKVQDAFIFFSKVRRSVKLQYGVLTALFDEVEDKQITPDFIAEVAEEITRIVASHSQVDWTNNKTIHDRISQDIDDLFYKYEKERGLKLSFDLIDKIIDNVKTVALRRF